MPLDPALAVSAVEEFSHERPIRWGTFATVGAALVVGLTSPASAHVAREVVHRIDGS
jgi:hypothetical protein